MNKLSNILNNAADNHLSDEADAPQPAATEFFKSEYSCIAVCESTTKYYKDISPNSYIWESDTYFNDTVMPFLKSLGLILHTEDARDEGEFNEFPKGPERQAARYCWLKFAAMIAEEEGL